MKFSSTELSEICSGVWCNLDKEVTFTGISYVLRHVKKGDLFIVRVKSDYREIKKDGRDDIEKAIKRGVKGFLVSGDVQVEGMPYFTVKNTKYAFLDIAKYNVKQCKAKRVLVTGSYGKTGFKVRLAQLMENKVKINAIRNSSNQDSGVFLALSEIEPDDDVAIIEVSASSRHRTLRRAEAISPDIAVITSIGHEHIDRHGSIDNVINQKTSVVKEMGKDSYCIIANDKYYEKTFAALLQHNSSINILSFGEAGNSDAFVVDKEFIDFGWNVNASIRGEVVSFRVPLIDSFAVSAAVSELLCADLLGVDVRSVAGCYDTVVNYKTSGGLFFVKAQGKKFILYDQSHRGGVENYERFFETLSYIKPCNDGRKILLTSSFMDYKDGDIKYVDSTVFKRCIDDSGIVSLFSVEYFPEHLDVLSDKNIWLGHKTNCEDIFDNFFEYIKDDDFVCVKGIFESKLKKFMDYLINIRNAEILPIKNGIC